jgi:hypothetical protein
MKTTIILTAFIIFLISCKKKVDNQDINFDDNITTDAELLDLVEKTTDYRWYKNNDDILTPGSRTGHTENGLRTKYNNIAQTQLENNFKVIENANFPDRSLIVKELYRNNNLGTYAIMYKKVGDQNADAFGWVWGYIRDNGTIRNAADRKGAGCTGCHSQNGNIDLTLMNLEHP